MPAGIVGRSPVRLQSYGHRCTTGPGTRRVTTKTEHCALFAFFVLRTKPLPGKMAAQEPWCKCQPTARHYTAAPLHHRPTTRPRHSAAPARCAGATSRRAHSAGAVSPRGGHSAPGGGLLQGSVAALAPPFCPARASPRRGPKKAVSGGP